MPSLGLQLSSAISQLGSFLTIRGETNVEHYFAQALTLVCLQPGSNDVTPYEATLLMFIRHDRRNPNLPRLMTFPEISLVETNSAHFINSLGEQAAFQPIYQSARQLDGYGAIARSRKKMEHIILLSREIAGRSLLAPASAAEELYLRLAVG